MRALSLYPLQELQSEGAAVRPGPEQVEETQSLRHQLKVREAEVVALAVETASLQKALSARDRALSEAVQSGDTLRCEVEAVRGECELVRGECEALRASNKDLRDLHVQLEVELRGHKEEVVRARAACSARLAEREQELLEVPHLQSCLRAREEREESLTAERDLLQVGAACTHAQTCPVHTCWCELEHCCIVTCVSTGTMCSMPCMASLCQSCVASQVRLASAEHRLAMSEPTSHTEQPAGELTVTTADLEALRAELSRAQVCACVCVRVCVCRCECVCKIVYIHVHVCRYMYLHWI